MCRFKSAIVLKNGDILHNQFTDSHSELIQLFKLNEGTATADALRPAPYARVEFSPPSIEDYDKPEKYVLTIDEERVPEWFDDDRKSKVAERMRGWIEAMIVRGPVEMLCGGAYILSKGATVQSTKHCLIHVMLADSKVGEMWESSKVGEMWGSSKVGVMCGSSKVGVMWESSNVGVMRESSKAPKPPTTNNTAP